MVALLAGLWLAPAASAESPVEVADELAVDGVYIAPGRDGEVDEAGIAEAIRQSRALGLRLVVVLPNDPQPDPAAFSRRVLEASDADAAMVFPLDGGLEANVIDELESASLRALAAGRSKTTPLAAVEAYSAELLADPTREVPAIVGELVRWVILLAVVLAGAVAIEQVLRRMFKKGPIAVPRPGPPSR